MFKKLCDLGNLRLIGLKKLCCMFVHIHRISSVHRIFLRLGALGNPHRAHIGGGAFESVHLNAIIFVIPLFPELAQQHQFSLAIQTIQL